MTDIVFLVVFSVVSATAISAIRFIALQGGMCFSELIARSPLSQFANGVPFVCILYHILVETADTTGTLYLSTIHYHLFPILMVEVKTLKRNAQK